MKDDLTLLDDAKRMNGDALAMIFDRYAPALYNYALRFCHDAMIADEVVGEVFTELLQQLSAGNGPASNLRSYLFEMTHHLLVDNARYRQRMAPLEAAQFSQRDGNSIYLSVENQVLLETMLQAVQNDLTEDQRHVVFLRFLEGFSLNETAAIVGKTVDNVKMIQHRALAALHKVLDHQVIEADNSR